MKKLYKLHYFVLVFFLLIATKSSAHPPSTNYFRSVRSGAWESPNTWEVSTDGINNWLPSSTTPTSAANTITIGNNHNVSITSSVSIDEVVVASGGILELTTTQSSLLTINDGAGFDITVQGGGVFKHNIATNSSLPIFNESATFQIQQGGIFEAANNNGTASNYANTASAVSSHIIWEDGSIFNWNTTSTPAEGVTYFPANAAIPIFRVSQPVTIGGTVGTVFNGLLEANANVSFQSNGTKTFRNGITGTGKVSVTALNGGQFTINGATAKLGGTGILELNNNGLVISTATTLTLTSNKVINNYYNGTSTSSGAITNSGTLIAEDFVISGNSKIQIDGTLKTKNAYGLSGGEATTFSSLGGSGFTVQSLGASSTIEYNRDGAQVITPLSYTNLNILGVGVKTAGNGADISVSGLLKIQPGNTFALNGTNNLKLNGGGTLTIYNNAVFDNVGESQVSGGSGPAVNIYGTFITRDAQGFTGTNTSIPGAAVTIFDGSTIEYGRTGDQTVTSRSDYKNLTFSGSGIKTIPTCRPIGIVTIKDNAIADASNKTFGDTTATHLVMTGGRFRVGGTGTKPDILGTYTLTGGAIEFTNSGATKQTIRSTPIYWNIEVSGTNVTNSVSTTKLANGGSFTIKTGGSYDNNADKIDGTVQGVESFIMETGSTFKTGVKGGFYGNDSAALQNIDNILIDAKSTIIYSRSGNQTITPLTGFHPALLLKGSGIKTVSSGILSISPSSDSIVIDPLVVLKVNSGAKIDFKNRPVIIHSSATSTGMIGEIADSSAALLNMKNVTVERYIPARRAFRFLSSAVTTMTSIKDNWMEGAVNPNTATKINPKPGYGTNITGKDGYTNNFDPTITNNASLFIFNAADQKWESVLNTNGTLSAGTAYRLMVRGDRSIDMTTATNDPAPTNTILRSTGEIFTGTFSPILSRRDAGYSFIGNPYASAIDFEKMVAYNLSLDKVTGTANNIKPEYTVWDPRLNKRGAYVTYNAVQHKTNAGISEVNRNIQPGQAVFVQTISSASAPLLQFKESYKSTVNTNSFRNPSEATKLSVQLLLNLNEGQQNTADATTVFFDDNFSKKIGNEDSYKFTNLDESIAINVDGKSLSIEGRPNVVANDTIFLEMLKLRQNNYYLNIIGNDFEPNVAAFLKDAYLHIETPIDLSSATLLPFSIDTTNSASFAKNRFSIIFKSGRSLPVVLTNVSAFIKEDGIEVEWIAHNEMNIKKYEVEKSPDGKSFTFAASLPAVNNNATAENYEWFDENTSSGNNFYRIKIIENSGEVKYSQIANVNLSKGKPQIIVSPNPIMGNIINLRLKNIEKGVYNLNLYNNLGQSMYKAVLNNNVSASHTLRPLTIIPKGVYLLTLTKKDETIYKRLIFQ